MLSHLLLKPGEEEIKKKGWWQILNDRMNDNRTTYLGEVHASVILTAIKKGEPARFNNVIIKGNLRISDLDLPKENGRYIVVSRISITNCRIDGLVYFRDVIFKNNHNRDVNFNNTRFCGVSHFSGARFCQGANFAGATFESEANFRDAIFCSAVFTNAEFKGYANFRKARFCNVNNDVAILDGAKFKDYANFKDAIFYANAFFNWTFFNDIANFNDAIFKGFGKFENATLKDGLFENTSFSGKDKLSMNGIKYENVFINWKDIYKPKRALKWFLDIGGGDNYLSYNDTIYPTLIENFKKIGFFNDADDCYYYYRNQCREKLNPIHKIIDFFFMLFCGYGTKPIRTGIWFLVFIT